MAKFYVLPSRELLGGRFSSWLTAHFPGIQHTSWDYSDLAESLANLVQLEGKGFVVYREDLDGERSVAESLAADYGAEADDEIIEIELLPGVQAIVQRSGSNGGMRKSA
jgi:hypothetical protein